MGGRAVGAGEAGRGEASQRAVRRAVACTPTFLGFAWLLFLMTGRPSGALRAFPLLFGDVDKSYVLGVLLL